MAKLESAKRLLRRWFTSIPLFIALGLILGGLIAVPLIPRPTVATITISGTILNQTYVDGILDDLQNARDDSSIKAVVLRIDSPGGGASAAEQIYLDVLRLRQQKPVVTSIGIQAASGGYYIAVASNYIYAEPTSQVGSIGAWVTLPTAEQLDENLGTSGPFKATGASRRKVMGILEMVRQGFVSAVSSQRGERLKLSEEEISRAEIYVGIDSVRFGLIDGIGTRTDAIEKAASLAGLRNYDVVNLRVVSQPSFFFFGSSDLDALKSQSSLVPVYYYLYFEQE